MKPQKLAFERQYGDRSGVEIGVYFDELKKGNDGGPLLEIQAVDTITVDWQHIDFLITALQAIRDNWEES